MGLSNRLNLPEELVRALSKNRYGGDTPSSQRTDFSITSLIAPAQQVILKKRYPDCADSDVIDNLWSMFGSIAHTLLEEHGSEESLVEKRFYADVLGKSISGGVDHLKGTQITDYKVTSVWKVQKKSYTEWEQQLNCYAYLCRINGFQIDSIRIIAILRDWSEPDDYKPDYPKAPIEIINLPIWDNETCKSFIENRVALLIENSAKGDDDLSPCSEEEMWAQPSKWAVYKTLDSKRATRVFDTEKKAIGSNMGIVIKRNGRRRRCERYCQAANKCHQWLKFKEERDGVSDQQEHLF